jgi:hypothetical protein
VSLFRNNKKLRKSFVKGKRPFEEKKERERRKCK